MNHIQWNDVFELIDDPAGSPRRAELERHLTECSRCRKLLESQRSFERLVRTVPPNEPSAEFTNHIVGMLQNSRKERRLLRLLTILGAGIPMALVVVLFGYAVSLGLTTSSGTDDELFGGAFGNVSGALDGVQAALSSVLGDTGTTIAQFAQTDVISVAALAVASMILLFIADRLLLRRILRSRL